MTDKLNTNTIVPAGSTLTVGTAGGSVVMTDDVKVNTVKDAGGNTLFVSNGSGSLSSVKAGLGGADQLLSTTTVSSPVSAINFTSGIDSAYKEYVFKFDQMNTSVQDALAFQCSTDSGSNYNTTLTSSWYWAYHTEADDAPQLLYRTDMDKSQATTFQAFIGNSGASSDFACSGELHLFNPSSTTYVKNWWARVNSYGNTNWQMDCLSAGYFNTTSAIDAISFTFSSGDFQAGKIKMYGIAS